MLPFDWTSTETSGGPTQGVEDIPPQNAVSSSP